MTRAFEERQEADSSSPISAAPAFDLIDVRPRWQLLDAATARSFPYGAVGALRERRSMELAGTAWLVGAHTAVTAGHAVFDELELQLPGETEAIVVADGRSIPSSRAAGATGSTCMTWRSSGWRGPPRPIP